MKLIFPPLQFTGAHTESKCPDGFPGNRPLSLNRACWEGPQGPGMVNRMGNTLIERIHFTGVAEVQINQDKNNTHCRVIWNPNMPVLSDMITLEKLIWFQYCNFLQSVFSKFVVWRAICIRIQFCICWTQFVLICIQPTLINSLRPNDAYMHIVNWTPRNKFQWNFILNSYIFFQENAFENVLWEMSATLSRPQWVWIIGKLIILISSFH